MKTENENVKKPINPKRKSKNTEKIEKKLEGTTVRHLTDGEPSILNDLRVLMDEKEKERKKKEDISHNKEYGFDVPFINEMMNNFNKQMNLETNAFKTLIDRAENYIDDDDINLHIKLILDDKERVLFKELIQTTASYPICVTIGDYDFFFESFDEGKDPIFSFDKKSFNFFFGDNLDLLKSYLKDNKLNFGFRYNKKITFENLNIEIISKDIETKTSNNNKTEKDEIPTENNNVLKSTYKVKLSNSENTFFVITDEPGKIFNHFTDLVESIKLMGKGIII